VLDLEAVENEPNERVKEIRRRLCVSESRLMMICNSEHVIKCFDVYENKSLKIMVLEYCNGGDLQE
jgi:serine/threonine protein kinase